MASEAAVAGMATILSAKLKVKQAININFKQSAVNVRLAARFCLLSAVGRRLSVGSAGAKLLPCFGIICMGHCQGCGCDEARSWN